MKKSSTNHTFLSIRLDGNGCQTSNSCVYHDVPDIHYVIDDVEFTHKVTLLEAFKLNASKIVHNQSANFAIVDLGKSSRFRNVDDALDAVFRGEVLKKCTGIAYKCAA